ncbi:unnamed protein product, partial [Laminaria digitata]
MLNSNACMYCASHAVTFTLFPPSVLHRHPPLSGAATTPPPNLKGGGGGETSPDPSVRNASPNNTPTDYQKHTIRSPKRYDLQHYSTPYTVLTFRHIEKNRYDTQHESMHILCISRCHVYT